MPLFSVIIPVYNRTKSILCTIDSVFKQSFNDYELIIIDDGSTDSLYVHLEPYSTNSRFLYFFQNNCGVSAARNKGADLASGEYLIFLDSDDSVSENWLMNYSEMISKYQSDVIYCGINRVKENYVVEYTNPNDPYNNSNDFGNVLPGSFCLKKTIFILVGKYDEHLSYGENTELSIRIKKIKPSFSFIQAPNLFYSINLNGLSNNAKNKISSLQYILNKHQDLFNSNKDVKSKYYSIIGVSAANLGDFVTAKNYFFKAFLLNPLDIVFIFRLLVVSIPFLRSYLWLRTSIA